MKYIKEYNNYYDPKLHRMGKIIVLKSSMHYKPEWFDEGEKFQVADYGDSYMKLKRLKDGKNYSFNPMIVSNNSFMTLEDWELYQATKKYNL